MLKKLCKKSYRNGLAKKIWIKPFYTGVLPQFLTQTNRFKKTKICLSVWIKSLLKWIKYVSHSFFCRGFLVTFYKFPLLSLHSSMEKIFVLLVFITFSTLSILRVLGQLEPWKNPETLDEVFQNYSVLQV